MARLLEDTTRGRIRQVVVRSYSRLAGAIEELELLLTHLHALGVRVSSQLDPSPEPDADPGKVLAWLRMIAP